MSWRKALELADQALYLAKRSGRNAWIGLATDESTNVDKVRQWLAEPSDSTASEAGLQVVAHAHLHDDALPTL